MQVDGLDARRLVAAARREGEDVVVEPEQRDLIRAAQSGEET